MNAARAAFLEGNKDSSRRIPSQGVVEIEGGHVTGDSQTGKSILYSALDGISTSYLLLLIATGSGLSFDVAWRLACAGTLGLSMTHTLRDWAKARQEDELYERERERERWELINYEEGEVKEMLELWQSKGVPKEDAKTALCALVTSQDFFLDLMMSQELNLLPSTSPPWKIALSTFCGFNLSAAVPLALLRFLSVVSPGLPERETVLAHLASGTPSYYLLALGCLALALPLLLVEYLRAWSVPLLHSLKGQRLWARAASAATNFLPVLLSAAALSLIP